MSNDDRKYMTYDNIEHRKSDGFAIKSLRFCDFAATHFPEMVWCYLLGLTFHT